MRIHFSVGTLRYLQLMAKMTAKGFDFSSSRGGSDLECIAMLPSPEVDPSPVVRLTHLDGSIAKKRLIVCLLE